MHIFQCLDAHQVGGVTKTRPSRPLPLIVGQRGGGLQGQLAASHPAAVLSLVAEGDDGVTDSQQDQPLGVVWQSADRIDQLPHVLHQGRIAIEQDAPHQHGIRAADGQGKCAAA